MTPADLSALIERLHKPKLEVFTVGTRGTLPVLTEIALLDEAAAAIVRLREELRIRAKQLGVACMKHDLIHTLACGACLHEAEAEIARRTELLRRWHETYGGSTQGKNRELVDAALDAETEAVIDAVPPPAAEPRKSPMMTGLAGGEIPPRLASPSPAPSVDNDMVICPNCVHQFVAIPVNVQQRVAELERERDALKVEIESLRDDWGKTQSFRKEWARECADVDNILFASGIEEPHWRTDGGSLQVARIINHFNALKVNAERYRKIRDGSGGIRTAQDVDKLVDAAIDAAKEKP
jgi:hypothetical protein